MRAVVARLVSVACVLALAAAAGAQQILLDEAVRADTLWCFPSAKDPGSYYYVPRRAGLVLENGLPAFSFVRYVVNEATEAAGAEGITGARGGGVLSFRATYETPEEDLRRAEAALRAKVGNDEVVLRGPIIFKEGRYALVSSIVTAGEPERHLLATGNAPVLEGNQLAFSFEVDAERATLLLRSFEMATPDVSVVFDMTIEGLTEAYDAEVVVDWDKVYDHQSFSGFAGVDALSKMVKVGAEVKAAFDALREDNAIRVTTRGQDERMDAILDRTLGRFIDLVFDKVEPEAQPEAQQGGGDILGGILETIGGFLENMDVEELIAGQGLPTIRGSVGYQLKSKRRSGTSRLDLSSRTTAQRHATMAFNVGNLYERHKGDRRLFRTVNLDDEAFVQREIHVGVDGAILPEFDAYINSVTVTLRKEHESGEETLRELLVSRETFDRPLDDFRMIYGWYEDANRSKWLEYDYRTSWSFKGGGIYETEWQRDTASMIDLYAPYERRPIQILGDRQVLEAEGIRAVHVEVEYEFFGGVKKADRTILTPDADGDHQLEITLPRGETSYAYTVTWLRKDGAPLVQSGRDNTGVLFLDILPSEPAPIAGGGL